MAKVLNVGGKQVTTDEDWYEVDAFGKRSGARYAPGGGEAAPAPPPTPTANRGTPNVGAGAIPPPAPSAPSTSASPSLQGLESMMGGGEGGGAVELPVPGSMKALGKRIMPNESAILSGRRVY